jgi:hypothetical protein
MFPERAVTFSVGFLTSVFTVSWKQFKAYSEGTSRAPSSFAQDKIAFFCASENRSLGELNSSAVMKCLNEMSA